MALDRAEVTKVHAVVEEARKCEDSKVRLQ